MLTNFIKQDKKHHICQCHHTLHWKNLSELGSGLLYSGRYKFSEIVFLLEKSSFIIGNKCCQLLSLKWQVYFIYFSEDVSKYPRLSKHSLSVTLSSSNSVPWKRWLVQLAIQMTHDCLFLRQVHASVQNRSAQCTMLKKRVLKDWDFIRFLFFTVSSRTFFFLIEVWLIYNIVLVSGIQ